MPAGTAFIKSQVKEKHDITFYENVVCDLETRVSMMNARTLEGSSITHCRRLLVTGVHSQTLGSELFTIHLHNKMVIRKSKLIPFQVCFGPEGG